MQPLSARHIPALDGLRGIAALMVIGYHVYWQWRPTSGVADRAIAVAASLGWAGVDLFFVLSGFLITGILLDSKGRPGYLRTFYARRALRIFPLYYASIVLFMTVVPSPPIERPWAFWLYLSNFSLAAQANPWERRPIDVAWTLAIEEQFYLVWPWLILALGRRALVAACVALVGGALLWRAALLIAGVSRDAILLLTPGHLDALAIGALVSIAVRDPRARAQLARWSWLGVVAGLVALGCVRVVERQLLPATPTMQTIGYSGIVLLAAAIIGAATVSPPRSPLATILGNPILRAAGRHSYAMYLLHFPIMVTIVGWVTDAGIETSSGTSAAWQYLLLFGCTSVATFAVAWAVWHAYEKHFLALKRFFPYEPGKVGTDDRPAARAAR
jgi:peptidoglycan/LPS O-acetylase OafA/YrhL